MSSPLRPSYRSIRNALKPKLATVEKSVAPKRTLETSARLLSSRSFVKLENP